MRILALCGSQRSVSKSAALLRAARELAPPGVEVELFEDHKRLPLFNPELEPDMPEPARLLRAAVTNADAVLIASPEYAHGVTATIKNTLDWLVSHEPFAFKPVAVFNPAYQSYHADDALKETLRTMSAELVDGACVRIPVIGAGVALDAIAADARFADAIRAALAAIVAHVAARG